MAINTLLRASESKAAKFIFGSTKLSWLWLVIRLYIGWDWLHAGWEKLGSPVWTGARAGTAVTGFLQGALNKTAGAHPDVQSWFVPIIHFFQNHPVFFSFAVTYGEILVGVALIIGLFTEFAALMGLTMNFSYLLAGTVSTNPQMVALQFLLILAHKTAGYIGIDHFRAKSDEPWHKIKIFHR